MELRLALTWILAGVFLRARASHVNTVLNCCEGDVLFVLDSSGSVSSYEFSRMLAFLSELLQPFSLGPDQVQVGLLQVGTVPHLQFSFGSHSTQEGLQAALIDTQQLRGDTNTEAALKLAREEVMRPGRVHGAREGLPKVLVWVTDGLQPGAVEEPMAALRQDGVAVLAVSTGHGNYQVLRKVVTPPTSSHLYFVDVDDMSIITEQLRDAIVEIIRAERLQVRNVTAHSAVLHWRPILSAGTGYYNIRVGPVPQEEGADGATGGGSGTSPSTSGAEYQRVTRPGDAKHAELSRLRPGVTYRATLTPESKVMLLKPLTVTFTTLPEVLSPSVIMVSDSGSSSVRVSWGPLQVDAVQSYKVEYSPLPGGPVRMITVDRSQNSTLLTRLQPDTQYLVTVSAVHSSGQEKAMSVKVCTQEELLPLADLQLSPVGGDSVQVEWKGSAGTLQGYWVTWQGANGSGLTSSRYLPPDTLSTVLTQLPARARVCVSPVYRTARGDGLCCTASFLSDAPPRDYSYYSHS
ncbi:von Willebrand factor A domain-containing protein 1 [Scleropages formosus]|nr:von Willebrand factor A domain-containing protein 1-like [Scleropages formosus]